VNVICPFASLGPEADEIDELAPPGWLSVTVFPGTGLPSASESVTVTVDVVEPSAGRLAGAATTVESAALTTPTLVEIAGLVPVRPDGVVSSVAVTV
jgi:hypothetical protein